MKFHKRYLHFRIRTQTPWNSSGAAVGIFVSWNPTLFTPHWQSNRFQGSQTCIVGDWLCRWPAVPFHSCLEVWAVLCFLRRATGGTSPGATGFGIGDRLRRLPYFHVPTLYCARVSTASVDSSRLQSGDRRIIVVQQTLQPASWSAGCAGVSLRNRSQHMNVRCARRT